MALTIYDKIKKRRLELNLSQEELAKKMGYKSRSTINKIESGKVDIARNKIAMFAKVLNVSPSYLMGWDDVKKKDNINFTQDGLLHAYPYIPYAVSAGSLSNINAMTELPHIKLPDSMLGKYARCKNLIFMTVNGESMNQIIDNGATIAVKTDTTTENLHDGDIVVVAAEGNYTVKRFYNDKINKRYIFRPDSSCPEFIDIIFSYDNCNDLQLIGKVVMYNVFL